MTEAKKQQLFKELAKEIRDRHNLQMYNECLTIGSMIYNMTQRLNDNDNDKR